MAKDIRLGSNAMCSAAGILRFAINGAKFKRDLPAMVRVMQSWKTELTDKQWRDVLTEKIPHRIEGENVVIGPIIETLKELKAYCKQFGVSVEFDRPNAEITLHCAAGECFESGLHLLCSNGRTWEESLEGAIRDAIGFIPHISKCADDCLCKEG